MTSRILFTASVFGLLLAIGLAFSQAQAAPDIEGARKVVQKIADTGISEVVGANVSYDEKIERFRKLFDTWFDMPAVSRFVLGRFWRTAPEEEQKRFIEQFRELNIYTWAQRFNEYNGQKLVVTTATADGEGGAFVESQIEREAAKPMVVLWRLRLRGSEWKVVDLSIEGVSMAITFRSEYAAKLSEPGTSVASLNALIAAQTHQLSSQIRR